MKRFFALLLTAVFAFCLLPLAQGKAAASEARDITADCVIKIGGKAINAKAVDSSDYTYAEFDNVMVSITAREPIGGVYLKFNGSAPKWNINYNGKTYYNPTGFLHSYQSVDESAQTIALGLPGKVSVAEIRVLSKGDKLPSFVQVWQKAEGNCDLMIFACHGGDDQLYFAGAIPDALNRGAKVQVCYFINPSNTVIGTHELLNGLWASGLDRYPVISAFPDTYLTRTEAEALKGLNDKGFTYAQMVDYAVTQLRRFKPQVVLTHDEAGEYGHGAHMLASHVLRDAVDAAADTSKYPNSASYGAWDVPKVYIHLLSDNAIDFEIDTPLERFNGMTAFNVSQNAMRCHASQQEKAQYKWLFGADGSVTKSTQLTEYSPRKFGLWHSTVGEDTVKKDFYENLNLSGGETPTEPPETEEPTTEPPQTEEPTEPPVTAAPATAEPAPTEAPTEAPETTAPGGVPTNEKLPSPVLIAFTILLLLAAAGVAIHFIIKFN